MSMTISTDAAARRESARTSDGTFGHQQHAESSVSLTADPDGQSRAETTAQRLSNRLAEALPRRGGNHEETIRGQMQAVLDYQPEEPIAEEARQGIEKIREATVEFVSTVVDQVGSTRQQLLSHMPMYGGGGPFDTSVEASIDRSLADIAHERSLEAARKSLGAMMTLARDHALR